MLLNGIRTAIVGVGMATARFTGSHTTVEKLEVLSSYLNFFTKALKLKKFKLIYIDAFAGTGDYHLDLGDAGLFAGFGGDQGLVTRPGSARLALAVDPPFDELVFVDMSQSSVAALSEIREATPDRKIDIRRGDANAEVQRLCSEIAWHSRSGAYVGSRAVLFLDPFALSVEWKTLLAIGATQAIDLWYLFPTNAIGRLLARDAAAIKDGWEQKLNTILGGNWWRDELYAVRPGQRDLFDQATPEVVERTARLEQIEQSFITRLEPHFGFIAPKPRRLSNNNLQRFSLMFAVANRSEPAIALAKRVAGHILQNGRR